jgi:hypothetical protein
MSQNSHKPVFGVTSLVCSVNVKRHMNTHHQIPVTEGLVHLGNDEVLIVGRASGNGSLVDALVNAYVTAGLRFYRQLVGDSISVLLG